MMAKGAKFRLAQDLTRNRLKTQFSIAMDLFIHRHSKKLSVPPEAYEDWKDALEDTMEQHADGLARLKQHPEHPHDAHYDIIATGTTIGQEIK